MPSVGQILKETRKKKGFTLEDVHKFVKIHPTFLEALERGDYSVFAHKIQAKGFLKNYAEFLELDIDQLLAFWRREYEVQFDKPAKKEQEETFRQLDAPRILLTPGLVLSALLTLLVVGFFGYLFYQYRSYSGAPRLEIYTPQNSIVVASDVLDVTGTTDRDSVLLINNQRVILDKDGSFVTSLKLKPGINTLSFLAVNKLGRETEEIRTIIYRSPEQPNVDLPEESKEASESTPSLE